MPATWRTSSARSLPDSISNYYIHDKFMLVDPLGDDPIVVTGSANFSGPSQHANDENMLVIRGNKRVADIYFGEFMRIFDHSLLALHCGEDEEGRHQRSRCRLSQGEGEGLGTAALQAGRKDFRRRYFMGAA